MLAGCRSASCDWLRKQACRFAIQQCRGDALSGNIRQDKSEALSPMSRKS